MVSASVVLQLLTSALAGAVGPTVLTGSGATFPAPVYQRWFQGYAAVRPDVKFEFAAVGSVAGIRALLAKSVDFAASDLSLEEAQFAESPDILYFPTMVGAICVSYTLDIKALQLSPEVLSAVFMGEIERWNDPRIAKENPGVNLPDQAIHVVHRADATGSTFLLTEYLSKNSPAWKEQVGVGPTVKWPVGLSVAGSEAIVAEIKRRPGTISYLEVSYARRDRLPIAKLKNRQGQFVLPSPRAVFQAVADVPVPSSMRVSLSDAGNDAYPLSSYTYLLVRKSGWSLEKREAFIGFLDWALREGRRAVGDMDLTPLPKELVARELQALARLREP